MQVKALVILCFIGIMPRAFAQFYPVQFYPAEAYVRVLPGQISAQVSNHHSLPIVCSGYVFGRTAWGLVLNSYFAEQVLFPGQHRYAIVVSTPYQPFIAGWSNIVCQQRW